LVQEASVWLYLDLGFNFHLEFRQYKLIKIAVILLSQQVKFSLLLELSLFSHSCLQSQIKVTLFLFASRSFLANNLHFMVKLIVKAIVKIHKNERKGLIRAIKKI
jgi:hypothetical protein